MVFIQKVVVTLQKIVWKCWKLCWKEVDLAVENFGFLKNLVENYVESVENCVTTQPIFVYESVTFQHYNL